MPDLARLTAEQLRSFSDEDFRKASADVVGMQDEFRKETQILFYKPASPPVERIHRSKARILGCGGGNRSSKTESLLVETIACMTGVFPKRFDSIFREKFRGPINVRLCIESLTTVLHPIILPKLMWWRWSGIDRPGGLRGHWGWVPRQCLRAGEWEKSWSEKLRTLSVLCRDPDDPSRILGESQLQIMSYDQDASDYASGTFHIVHMDEPPPFAIWRENQARVMDVAGRLFLSMTWPDDPSISVDWIYDEVYERGLPGPMKDPAVDWIELQTTDNVHLSADAILEMSAGWSEETRKVRLQGQPLRFSNRIHPLFTDVEQTWCFTCGKGCVRVDDRCGCKRQSENIVDYVHVEEFEIDENWPVVMLLDPHPRKPHVLAWVAIDPGDDLWMVQEAEIEGDATDVRMLCDEIEETMGLNVRLRLMDPNMGRSPSGMRREITWQDEFISAGLAMDLADDSDVGRKRVNQYLKPDDHTRRPRMMLHSRCQRAAMQMKRFVWDDFRRSADRDLKQTPKDKYSDWPALWRYLLNYEPTFLMLYGGAPVIGRPGTRVGAY